MGASPMRVKPQEGETKEGETKNSMLSHLSPQD